MRERTLCEEIYDSHGEELPTKRIVKFDEIKSGHHTIQNDRNHEDRSGIDWKQP
jgi:hypothetical protein